MRHEDDEKAGGSDGTTRGIMHVVPSLLRALIVAVIVARWTRMRAGHCRHWV